ncbi:ribonuclease H-like domain-containing protein [Tanacetum coccineum]|uniref:Ribonuclease H-like domain-containing protein n=1 Tax=Tanacetum coccineum TaxID=301880 RepID=A0ABQ5CUY4_9ASTR
MAGPSPPPPITGGGSGDNPQVVLISNLDAGNPLHVHNSDNSSSVLVPFKLLGTENYRMWNNAMKLALQARNKYGFVDGTCLRDSYADSDVLCAQWDSKIGSVKQGGSTVVDYYHKLNSLWREFDAITKVPKCVCPVKCSCAASTELALHQQLMKLMQFLMGLDDCYQPVRTALLTRDPLPDVKDAYAAVSREESHKGIPETLEAIDIKMHATSFAAKSYNQNKRGTNNNFNRYNIRGNGPYNNRGPNPNLTCKNCGFTSHTIERCYELIGYPPGYKKPNAPKQNVFKPNFNANCDTKGSDK